MEKMVLIVTQEVDSHTDLVVEKLNERNVPVFRFHTFDFPQRSTMTASINSEHWTTLLDYYHRRVDFDQITSVWYRRPRAFDPDPEMTEPEKTFVNAEGREAFGGLLRTLNCLWVNHPDRLTTADYKPYQLRIARELGMEIPPTLITNNPEEVPRFFEQCKGHMIYKPMSAGLVMEDDEKISTIFTNTVHEEDLQEVFRVRQTPCLFQERIPKKLELRITIIGNKVFAAEIHSQASERSATDWRLAYHELTYDIHQLPDKIRLQCLALTQRLGLAFGAIDMIITPDDRYVFLEINSNGQYSWIEGHTGMPLNDAMADLLSS